MHAYHLPAPDMSKQFEGHYETYLHYLSESLFGFDHLFQPSIKIAILVKFASAFTLNQKQEKFVMLSCFTGDKKELILKRFHVTLAGRCFQARHA